MTVVLASITGGRTLAVGPTSSSVIHRPEASAPPSSRIRSRLAPHVVQRLEPSGRDRRPSLQRGGRPGRNARLSPRADRIRPSRRDRGQLLDGRDGEDSRGVRPDRRARDLRTRGAPPRPRGDWRRAFFRARELHSTARYFAWAPGHDILEPRWLEMLAAEMDAHSAVVGAFPSGLGVKPDGSPPSELVPTGDTFGLDRARDRVRVPLRGMAIQGLFRPEPLRRAGVKRRVLAPDRLLMAELAAHGQLRHVPERLWERRMNPKMTKRETRARQRRTIFPPRARALGHVHWLALHAAALVWSLSVRGNARPQVSRAEGAAVAAAYVRAELPRYLRNVHTRHRVRLTRLRKARRRLVRVRRLRRRARKDYRRARRELRRVRKTD